MTQPAGEANEVSLYAAGWRQGSMFAAELPAATLTVNGGTVRQVTDVYPRWVVATQDCDLDNFSTDGRDPCIELRPVLTGNPGIDWGIRSRRMRLTDDGYVDAALPKLMATAELLTAIALPSRTLPLSPERTTAWKTWLGLRYDRPAVPPEFVDLARAIAAAVKETRAPALADATHDVLMQFASGSPPRYALYAVVTESVASPPIALWMTAAALQVPADLGVLATPPVVVTKQRLSLAVIEGSYSADLSSITWKGETPRGAT